MEKKKKVRIRRKNSGIKKLILFLILLFIIIQIFIKVIIPGTVTFSRYVYAAVRTFYLNSKEFYFNSDKLSLETATFESDNWSGKEKYTVGIKMNSKKNLQEFSTVDINYDITYEYWVYKSDGTEYMDANGNSLSASKIDFYLEDTSGVIDTSSGVVSRTIFLTSSNEDEFSFSIIPKTDALLQDNDYVFVRIKATSTDPYISELVGEFKIKIGTLGMSYEIEDYAYEPYCEVIVTNTLDYYTVEQAFGSYAVGNTIPIVDYLQLTDAEKANCYSMKIHLAFDPNVVVLDTTSNIYIGAENQDIGSEMIQVTKVETVNGTEVTNTYDYNYINKISFNIEAEESKVIKFYKIDAAQDYTYPSSTQTDSVVDVTYS